MASWVKIIINYQLLIINYFVPLHPQLEIVIRVYILRNKDNNGTGCINSRLAY